MFKLDAYRPTMMKREYQKVVDAFERLSDSDRSCVLHMLKTTDADQLTSKGSAQDQFYLALKDVGWARRAELGEDLGGLLAAWTLTLEGRRSAPNLLFVAGVETRKAEYESQLSPQFAGLALKFGAGYALVQISAGLAAYGLTRIGVDIKPAMDVLSVGLLFGSCAAGVFAAVMPGTFRPSPADRCALIGASEAIASHRWLLCAWFAAPVFVFYFLFEHFMLRFDPLQAATRSAAITVLVGLICQLLTPSILALRTRQLFKV